MRRFLVWILEHPAWAGISGILGVVALAVALIDVAPAPAPPGGAGSAAPTAPATRADPADFLVRFNQRLIVLGLQLVPEVKTLTPTDFTDETAQAIVDAASPGALLFLRTGTYRLSELRVDKPLVILGEDALETRLLFTRWSLSVQTPLDGSPAWIANLTLDYGGNDYAMYSLETRGPTLLTHARIEASSLFAPFLIIAIEGLLTVEDSVLVSRPNANGTLLLPITSNAGWVGVSFVRCTLVADTSTTIVTVSNTAEAAPAPRAELSFVDNLLIAEQTGDGPPARIVQVTGGGEAHADFHLAQNVFAGWQLDGLDNVMLGRRDSGDINLPSAPTDEQYYRTPRTPLPVGATPYGTS